MGLTKGFAVAVRGEIVGGRQGSVDDAVPMFAGGRVGDGDTDAGGRGVVDDEEIVLSSVSSLLKLETDYNIITYTSTSERKQYR